MKALENPSIDVVKHRAENRKYYLKHRRMILVKSKENYIKYKDWYAKYGYKKENEKRLELLDILGGRCIKCNIDDWRVLQVDHINGGGNAERRSLKSPHAYRKVILGNIEKYQLLCANCNWIKRYEENELRKI